MASNIKISVIIPVYNTEQYLMESIGSIMHQTLRELQILVVNDGSTDNSVSVIRQLAETDNRIQIIDEENRGQAYARNSALQIAEGKYVYFLDSDDVLEESALAECYEKCEKYNLDFVLFNAETIGDASDCFNFDYHRTDCIGSDVVSGIDAFDRLQKKFKYSAQICLNLIKRSLLVDNDINFHSGIIHEDELFMAKVYLNAKRVSKIDKSFYRRRLRLGSTMTNHFSMKNVIGYKTVISELDKYKKEHEEFKSPINQFIRYMINPVMQNAWVLPFEERLRFYFWCANHHFCMISLRSSVLLIFKKPLKSILGKKDGKH